MTIVRRRVALIASTMLLAGAASSGVAMASTPASTPSAAPASVQTNRGHDHDRYCWDRWDGYGCYRDHGYGFRHGRYFFDHGRYGYGFDHGRYGYGYGFDHGRFGYGFDRGGYGFGDYGFRR